MRGSEGWSLRHIAGNRGLLLAPSPLYNLKEICNAKRCLEIVFQPDTLAAMQGPAPDRIHACPDTLRTRGDPSTPPAPAGTLRPAGARHPIERRFEISRHPRPAGGTPRHPLPSAYRCPTFEALPCPPKPQSPPEGARCTTIPPRRCPSFMPWLRTWQPATSSRAAAPSSCTPSSVRPATSPPRSSS